MTSTKDGADFALGKQTETIAQEDIEKAAEAFATPPIGNGGMFTHQQVKELLVRFAQLLLSKQEKDAEATSAASPKTTPASSAGTATNSAKNEKEIPQSRLFYNSHTSYAYYAPIVGWI